MQGDRSTAQRVAIPLFAVLQVLVTFLPSVGVGEPIGQRSDAVETAITPAGWAFSIWGPLFAGSLAYAAYQALPAQRTSRLLDRIGWASAGAFLGNGAWALYTQFTNLNAGSAIIIIFTLLCLLVCYRIFADLERQLSRGEQFLVVLPLSALAAWLTLATIVNTAASLKFHGLSAGDFGSIIGAGIIVVGGIIAAAAIWNGRGNPWYGLVFLWGLAGVYSSSQGRFNEVALAAILAAVLVLASSGISLARSGNWRRWTGSASAQSR